MESQYQSLKKKIGYYCSLNEPKYGVLVTGAWGVGKTFQVCKALEGRKFIYISLFGIDNTQDVYDAVFAKMNPYKSMAKQSANKLKSTNLSAFGFSAPIGGFIDGVARVLIKEHIDADIPIVFDDLERCPIPLNDKMGIVNHYVEHLGCKVIIIAHDSKIEKELSSSSEKTIGSIFEVTPDVQHALEAFLSEASSISSNIEDFGEVIFNVFMESGVASLRILRYGILDAAHYISLIDEEYIKDISSVSKSISILCAFIFQFRNGNIRKEDCNGDLRKFYYSSIVSREKEENKTPINQLFWQYSTVDFRVDTISMKEISEIVFSGSFDKDSINICYKQSISANSPSSIQAWRILYSYESVDDEVVRSALRRLRNDLRNHDITDAGDVLHSFAILMYLSSENIIQKSVSSILKDGKRYVDFLYREKKIEAWNAGWTSSTEFRTGANGYSFWSQKPFDDDFNELKSYLITARKNKLVEDLRIKAEQCLDLIQVSGSDFYSLVCFTNGGDNTYCQIPFLHLVPPTKFLKAWMKSPKSNWYFIASAIRDRYKNGELDTVLSEEDEWRDSVLDGLRKEIAKASGVSELRLRRLFGQIN